jgi:hypothetical protein
MPIKPYSKIQAQAYPSVIVFDENKISDYGYTKYAALCRVDEKNNSILTLSKTWFYINPTSFEESKNANWVQHNVPGQSDPVMQWLSSGAKTITFDALVTLDKSNNQVQKSVPLAQKDIGDKIANLAADLAKAQELSVVYKSEKTAQDLDISDKLEYYRSLMYPSYSNDNGIRKLTASPPRVVLLAGRTVTQINPGLTLTNKDVAWVVTDLKIKTTKMLPNLSPMEAVVSFTLVQYVPEVTDTYDFGNG